MDKKQMVINVFSKNAELYQERYMDVAAYSDMLDIFCNSIAKDKANLLDIACGPGNITKYVLSQKPGFEILGIDISPAMLALAAANNPTATFREIDCRDISKLSATYNGIIIGFCLPYLSREEVVKLFRDCAALLLPGGVLYISTMEDSYEKSGIDRSSSGDEVYIYYHESGYLHKSLEEIGFTVKELRRQENTWSNGKVVVDIEIVAIK